MIKPSSEKYSLQPCYHCGLDADPIFTRLIDGQEQAFCCLGCQAVAEAIAEGGLGDFYRYRDKLNARPETGLERFDAYDLAAVQNSFVSDLNDKAATNTKQVRLVIGGISCAACAWLIEHQLERVDGIENPQVNVANHIATFDWQPNLIKLSEIFTALHNIGYRPQPGTQEHAQVQRQQVQRASLLRIGVAGLGMMQVGMVAIALHAGNIQGIDENWQHFLRWISLFFAVPVIVFSAKPFFVSAFRALKLRTLNMDVPVSLALILAFTASVFGTVNNTGEVYFDSVSMFTFFLLVGRYLEMRARHTSVSESESLSKLLPLSAERVTEQGRELVPLNALNINDSVYVNAGDVIPVDGLVLSARAMLDESLVTGESEPVEKNMGDTLLAGSLLVEPAVTLKVTAVGENTHLSSVQKLLDLAIQKKPRTQQLADKISRYFVAAVIVCFILVFAIWSYVDASRAFWVALSVLVVTCPCALSLATPAALASGLNALRQQGFLVMSVSGLEVLPRVTHVVFDKTGTLTLGKPTLLNIQCLSDVKKEQVLNIVTALEAHSRHPFASVFREYKTNIIFNSTAVYAGQGVEGIQGDDLYRFGKASFACSLESPNYPGEGSWQLLSKNDLPIAWLQFGDKARADLSSFMQHFNQQGITISLLSGDRQANVDLFVEENLTACSLFSVRGDMLPENKLSEVQKLQSEGHVVMMVGDGINDVPVLGGADISIAMGSASQIAKASADTVLLNANLYTIVTAISASKRIGSVIKQNLIWALAYNVIALPAAVMGYVPPYLAAAGMSISSLVVVINSVRLNRRKLYK